MNEWINEWNSNNLFLDIPQLTLTDITLVTHLISRCRNFADIKLARIRNLREERNLTLFQISDLLYERSHSGRSTSFSHRVLFIIAFKKRRKRPRKKKGEVQKLLRSDWLSIATHFVLGQSERKEKKNTRDWLVGGFPRFAPAARTSAMWYDWLIWSSPRIVIGHYSHLVSMLLNWTWDLIGLEMNCCDWLMHNSLGKVLVSVGHSEKAPAGVVYRKRHLKVCLDTFSLVVGNLQANYAIIF